MHYISYYINIIFVSVFWWKLCCKVHDYSKFICVYYLILYHTTIAVFWTQSSCALLDPSVTRFSQACWLICWPLYLSHLSNSQFAVCVLLIYKLILIHIISYHHMAFILLLFFVIMKDWVLIKLEIDIVHVCGNP